MKQLPEVHDILKRAADKGGFERTKFVEKEMPTSISNVSTISLFGNMRSMYIASSLLLHRYKEEVKGSKYLVLASWPGFEELFPYVDEYWSYSDESVLRNFYYGARELDNTSSNLVLSMKNMNRHFYENVESDALSPYYDNGIKQEFFDRFNHVKVFSPLIPSTTVVGPDFNREMSKRPGYKIFLFPTYKIKTWFQGQAEYVLSHKEFWVALGKHLAERGFCPVIWSHPWAHELSAELTNDAIFLPEKNIGKVLAAMRACDCVLDVFNDTSRLALAARCPFLACDERNRYAQQKEYEIDDLCGRKVPREYIYSFSTIINAGGIDSWRLNIFDQITAKLDTLLPELDRDKWPPASESLEIVKYDSVRKTKRKRLGTRFIKVERI